MKIAPGRATTGRAAVEELVRRYQGSVRGYLVVLGCPERMLDDLVQDVFLSVLSGPFEDRGRPSTQAFLRKVARHKLLRAVARERRLEPLDLEACDEAWCELERDDGGERYLLALRECLGGVGPRVRDTLVLVYRERLRQAVVAERLGMSEAGVKSVLVRAKKQLRACIERRIGA